MTQKSNEKPIFLGFPTLLFVVFTYNIPLQLRGEALKIGHVKETKKWQSL